VHDELDRETLKLLEKQHRRRALNLRGCLVRVLVLVGPRIAEAYFGVLQGFGPSDPAIFIDTGDRRRPIPFDEIVDIRRAEQNDALADARRHCTIGDALQELRALEADLRRWSSDPLIGISTADDIGRRLVTVEAANQALERDGLAGS
jgi:hypothetical protein